MFLFPFHRARSVGAIVLAALIGAMIATLCAPRTAHAQPVRSATFLYLRGADTLGTETLSVRDADAVGVLAMRGQPRVEWTQSRNGATLGGLQLRAFTAGSATDAVPIQTARIALQGDTAVVELITAARTQTQKLPSRTGALSLVNSSVLHMVLLASAEQRAKLTTFDVFLTSGGQTLPVALTAQGDTLVMLLAGMEARALFGADGLPTLITTSQGVRVVRAAGAVSPGAAASMGTINYDAPAGAPYTAEHVRIPSGRGYDLAATLTMPKGVSKAPVLVTISGSGPQERDSRISIVPGYQIFRQIADTLGRRGVAVLRFDDRGVGESGGRESAAKATSADFADDVRSIVTWLRARPDIDGARVALAGHSEGGMIAPMVAASDPQLKAIALLAGPGYNGRTILMFQNRQGIDNLPGLTTAQRDSVYKTVPAALDSLGKALPWMGYFMSHDPVATAKKVKQPVLILQGETDHQVTPEQADTLAAAFRAGGNRTVTLRKFPSTNHLFLNDPSGLPGGYAQLTDPKVRPQVLGALADWVVQTLR